MARGFTFVPETLHLETLIEAEYISTLNAVFFFGKPDDLRGKDVRYKGRGVWAVIKLASGQLMGIFDSGYAMCEGERVVWAR